MAPEAPLVILLSVCDEVKAVGVNLTLEVTVVVAGEMIRLDDTTTLVGGLEYSMSFAEVAMLNKPLLKLTVPLSWDQMIILRRAPYPTMVRSE